MIAAAGSTFLPEPDRTDLDPGTDLLDRTGTRPSARDRCFTSRLIGFHHLIHDGLAGQPTACGRRSPWARTARDRPADQPRHRDLHLGDDDAFRRSFTGC